MLDGLLTAVFIRNFHNPQGVYQSISGVAT